MVIKLKTFRYLCLFVLVGMFAACSSISPKIFGDAATHITRKKVDFAEISWFARRAKAAYSKAEDIQKKFPQTVRINTPKGSDVQYFLEVIPARKIQLISIRGSDNLPNILQDLAYEKTIDSLLGMFVHRGIHDIALKIYADVKPHLKRNYKIRTTGHSLGAAVGVVLMMYLHQDGYSFGKSINFGQPKITSAAGAKRFQWLPVTRVINENDAIPMLPPLAIFNPLHGPYVHIGSEVILLHRDRYVFLDEHAAERISVGEFWRNIQNVSLSDHSMKKYTSRLAKMNSNAVQVSYADREAYAK